MLKEHWYGEHPSKFIINKQKVALSQKDEIIQIIKQKYNNDGKNI